MYKADAFCGMLQKAFREWEKDKIFRVGKILFASHSKIQAIIQKRKSNRRQRHCTDFYARASEIRLT